MLPAGLFFCLFIIFFFILASSLIVFLLSLQWPQCQMEQMSESDILVSWKHTEPSELFICSSMFFSSVAHNNNSRQDWQEASEDQWMWVSAPRTKSDSLATSRTICGLQEKFCCTLLINVQEDEVRIGCRVLLPGAAADFRVNQSKIMSFFSSLPCSLALKMMMIGWRNRKLISWICAHVAFMLCWQNGNNEKSSLGTGNSILCSQFKWIQNKMFFYIYKVSYFNISLKSKPRHKLSLKCQWTPFGLWHFIDSIAWHPGSSPSIECVSCCWFFLQQPRFDLSCLSSQFLNDLRGWCR